MLNDRLRPSLQSLQFSPPMAPSAPRLSRIWEGMEESHASFNVDIFSTDERVSQPSRPRVSFYKSRSYI
jgi:hypothetical protein